KLDEFEVPVAELTPEELVDRAGGLVKAVVGEGGVDGGGGLGETGDDPARFEGVGGASKMRGSLHFGFASGRDDGSVESVSGRDDGLMGGESDFDASL